MTAQQLERETDTRTPGERLRVIWQGLGEQALGLTPRRELEATMAAILLANDPTASIEDISLGDLHTPMASSVDVATGEELW